MKKFIKFIAISILFLIGGRLLYSLGEWGIEAYRDIIDTPFKLVDTGWGSSTGGVRNLQMTVWVSDKEFLFYGAPMSYDSYNSYKNLSNDVKLTQWKVGGGAVKQYNYNSGIEVLCYWDKNIFFIKGIEDGTVYSERYQQDLAYYRYEVYYGNINSPELVASYAKDDNRALFKAYSLLMRISVPFSCNRFIQRKDEKVLNDLHNHSVLSLIASDGFLDLGVLDDVRSIDVIRDYIHHYGETDNYPTKLNVTNLQRAAGIYYLQWEKSYFFTKGNPGLDSNNTHCRLFTTFYPKNKKIDQICMPYSNIERLGPLRYTLKTKYGLVVNILEQGKGISGLYFLENGRLKPLIRGWASSISVSPDGCIVTFKHADNYKLWRGFYSYKSGRLEEDKPLNSKTAATLKYVDFCVN